MSSGTLVLGVLNGLIIGLLAVGLVLVYKSNRFLNLAHAQLGALSALLLQKWVLQWGWNFWLALVLALLVGVATGLLVERYVIGPMRRRNNSPIRLLLLSLGVSQLLLGLTFIPALGPGSAQASQYPQPFHSTLRVGGVVLTGMWVLTAIAVPTVVIALAVFLRRSVLGKQIRAAASNPDAARLCGISVNRVSAVTWGIAGAFAALSAILQAPTQASLNLAAFGPYLLMLTLGAAALGAFVSVPGALAGGLLIGLLIQIVEALTSGGSDAELAVFAFILLIVLVRGRAIGRVFAVSGAASDDLPVTRIPDVLRNSPLVRHQRLGLTVGALFLAFVLPQLPYFNTSGNSFLLAEVAVLALVGVGLTMLLGWAGQVSLGHFALVGLGAYLTARWAGHGWSLPALFIVVGLVCAVVMALIGLPALRVRGLTLAVTTLGFAVVADDWLFNQSWLGGSGGIGSTVTPPPIGPHLGTPSSSRAVYYVAIVVLTLAVLAAGALRRSSAGRLILAVRDNERASSAFGVNPATVKIAILAASGFFAGAAGVLWADAWQFVTQTQFTADISIALLAIPVIGGLGSVGGSVAATFGLYGVTYFVGPHLTSVLGKLNNGFALTLILAGLGQIYVLLKFPTGIAGAVQARWEKYLEARAERAGQTSAQVVAGPPLAVEGVNVRFGGVVALDGIDIVVRPGEIVGLIGTNGAGKTTLMNVISGVLRPDRGSVSVFGNQVVDLAPDFRAAFGMARSFQDASLFAGLTVTETIQVALAQRHKVGVLSAMIAAPWVRLTERRMRRTADDIVERFGLKPWADSRTVDLSTGTRRICDLAAQVAARPKLLLLDEPTAGVAQREAEAFGPLLRRIRDELDCAILIVEHDMPLLMGLCDRVYALETGRVIAEGSPEEIRNDPRVVASYLGTEEAAIARSGRSVPVQPGSANGHRAARAKRTSANGRQAATTARSPARRPR